MKELVEFNSKLKYYTVVSADRVVGEDGKFVEGEGVGYAVVNNVTGVVEHTSTILPGVLFQAQHFDSTLASLLEEPATPELDDMPIMDVVPN